MAILVIKSVRNVSGNPINFQGQDILDGETYIIPKTEWDLWATDPEIISAISEGDLVVNDGTQDLPATQGLYLIENVQSVLSKVSHESLGVSVTTSTAFQQKNFARVFFKTARI